MWVRGRNLTGTSDKPRLVGVTRAGIMLQGKHALASVAAGVPGREGFGLEASIPESHAQILVGHAVKLSASTSSMLARQGHADHTHSMQPMQSCTFFIPPRLLLIRGNPPSARQGRGDHTQDNTCSCSRTERHAVITWLSENGLAQPLQSQCTADHVFCYSQSLGDIFACLPHLLIVPAKSAHEHNSPILAIPGTWRLALGSSLVAFYLSLSC